MKQLLLLILSLLVITPTVMATTHKKKKKPAAAAVAKQDDTAIRWISIDELQVKMKESPRKVYMDVYTDWCGWCKRMDATTFQNPYVIKYLNDNFYCVRFNAETKEPIHFMGKDYNFSPQNRANELAVQFLQGNMSYPTSVLMEKYFTATIPAPGYHPVPEMEMILKFVAEDVYKKESFQDYQKNFQGAWKETAGASNLPPVTH